MTNHVLLVIHYKHAIALNSHESLCIKHFSKDNKAVNFVAPQHPSTHYIFTGIIAKTFQLMAKILCDKPVVPC